MEVASDLVVRQYQKGLNPYYNGRYSWSTKARTNLWKRLNPYYNGRYSWRSFY